MIPCKRCADWMVEFLDDARDHDHISSIQGPILKMYLDEKLEEGIIKRPIP